MGKYPMSYEEYIAQQNSFKGKGANYGKKKRSGIKTVTPYGSAKGLFMAGWKVSNRVKWNVKVFRDKYQTEIAPAKSKTGKEWVTVRVIMNAPMKETVSISGLMNLANHKVYIKEWNWIMNPSAPNGGYIGKHISKK